MNFVKQRADVPPDFFAVEASGLEWLRETNTVAVPAVIAVGSDHIELERIDPGPWTEASDEQLGRELAGLQRGSPDVRT